MITITISGPRQTGKTTLADVLHAYLESCGCEVVEPNRPHSEIALQVLTHIAPKITIVEQRN